MTLLATIHDLADIRARHEREKHVLELLKQLEYLNIAHLFTREYKFHPVRKWRLDLFCSWAMLGVELHGGVHSHGRHTRGTGFSSDREKMNAAQEMGIRVLEYTPKEIKSGAACLQIDRVLKAMGEMR